MKKFFLCLGIFALIFLACDFIVGLTGNALMESAKGGTLKKKMYICNEAKEQVLVFGSSRAYRHYDPRVIEDSLSLSAYNCGLSANGIIGEYGFYKILNSRYNPEVVIYDIFPAADLLLGDNRQYLSELRYFYNRTGVDSLFWNVDWTERVKMKSRMYRYNSVFPTILREYIHPKNKFVDGFVLTNKQMPAEISPLRKSVEFVYDSLKLECVERLIHDCNGKSTLVFAVSPMYENTDDAELEPFKILCGKYGITLLNHYTDSAFVFRRDYFYDRLHMNGTGATEYSKVIAHEIRELLDQRE